MKVLLIDDHAIIREALRRLLTTFGQAEIVEASTGEEALTVVAGQGFDLIVLDLNLPGLGGLELLSRLIRIAESASVLVLSMNAEPIYVRRALALGAKGYVSKNASTEELLSAIAKVGRGGRYVEGDIAQALALSPGPQTSPLESLNERELEVMRLLASGQSLSEIAALMGLAYKTVANMCSQIKTKCSVSRTADLIRLAIQFQAS
jgi:two-component system invasion response regulator UvrY